MKTEMQPKFPKIARHEREGHPQSRSLTAPLHEIQKYKEKSSDYLFKCWKEKAREWASTETGLFHWGKERSAGEPGQGQTFPIGSSLGLKYGHVH